MVPQVIRECHKIAQAFTDANIAVGTFVASNPKYIEVWVRCGSTKANQILGELGYTQEGAAIVVEHGEEWYKSWVYPQERE